MDDEDVGATSQEGREEDYDEKAKDAIDYEDFDEQYDGPEVQEEDHLLPKKDYFSSMTVATLDIKSSVFDEDNYDEDDEITEETEATERNIERQSFSSADCTQFKSSHV